MGTDLVGLDAAQHKRRPGSVGQLDAPFLLCVSCSLSHMMLLMLKTTQLPDLYNSIGHHTTSSSRFVRVHTRGGDPAVQKTVKDAISHLASSSRTRLG